MRRFSLARAAAALALAISLHPAVVFAHHGDPAEHEAEAQAFAEAGSGTYSLGDLHVELPWSRATPPTANVAVGYLTLRNQGEAVERLIGGSSPAAQRVEVHTMDIVDDVMRMRHLEDGLEVPAGEEVSLAPGGYHLMLIGLDAPLSEGDLVPLTLEFEGGSLDIELAVQAMGASSGHDGHGGH